MTNLSNEELVARIETVNFNLVDGKIDYTHKDITTEILSRLNRLDEVEKENKRLSDREGNAKVNLIFPTETSPFRQVNLKIVDYGVSDNIYICESQEVEQLSKQVENLKCCGNCLNYIYDMEEDHHYCNKNIFHGKRHAGICSNNWQSDTMTREERK